MSRNAGDTSRGMSGWAMSAPQMLSAQARVVTTNSAPNAVPRLRTTTTRMSACPTQSAGALGA